MLSVCLLPKSLIGLKPSPRPSHSTLARYCVPVRLIIQRSPRPHHHRTVASSWQKYHGYSAIPPSTENIMAGTVHYRFISHRRTGSRSCPAGGSRSVTVFLALSKPMCSGSRLWRWPVRRQYTQMRPFRRISAGPSLTQNNLLPVVIWDYWEGEPKLSLPDSSVWGFCPGNIEIGVPFSPRSPFSA